MRPSFYQNIIVLVRRRWASLTLAALAAGLFCAWRDWYLGALLVATAFAIIGHLVVRAQPPAPPLVKFGIFARHYGVALVILLGVMIADLERNDPNIKVKILNAEAAELTIMLKELEMSKPVGDWVLEERVSRRLYRLAHDQAALRTITVKAYGGRYFPPHDKYGNPLPTPLLMTASFDCDHIRKFRSAQFFVDAKEVDLPATIPSLAPPT